MFELPAWLLAWFYSITHNYAISIALIALVVMLIITPLTLKSTKGMLEMQRLAPEMRKLQQQHRNDRQKLNEEMMKLYQEHKVNPMASCLPLVAQMPVFIIMFRILHGLTYRPVEAAGPIVRAIYVGAGQTAPQELGFVPRYISHTSDLYRDLFNQDLSGGGRPTMKSFGLDLAMSPAQALGDGLGKGLIYALLVVVLAGLYFLQQRMVAARAAVSPTMSASQQKLMQYLPVVFAIFQVFFLAGLIIYYAAQAILRIVQQSYITRRFYGHDESLGRQAQRASESARELAKADKDANGDVPAGGKKGGLFAQVREQTSAARDTTGPKNQKQPSEGGQRPPSNGTTKRTTAPKGRPTPSGGKADGGSRPATNRPGGARAKSAGKRRH
jgi:YidC/Oxa1 family membrane protein insertase